MTNEMVKNLLAYSLRRLGTEYSDMYRPARLDPAVPSELPEGRGVDVTLVLHLFLPS